MGLEQLVADCYHWHSNECRMNAFNWQSGGIITLD
jgi:hypothetical protein